MVDTIDDADVVELDADVESVLERVVIVLEEDRLPTVTIETELDELRMLELLVDELELEELVVGFWNGPLK